MSKKFIVAVAYCCSLLLSSPAQAGTKDTYTRTKYPIVLVHGMLGFDRLFNVLSYWYGIVEGLGSGGADVYVLKISNVNSDEVRGEETLAQVESILAMTSAAKVNLIGHSQGGHAVRYVANVRPDLVASVTTVASPNYGADFADFMLTHPRPGLMRDFLVKAVNAAGIVVGIISGDRTLASTTAMLNSLSSTGTAVFNASYPDGMPAVYCGEGPAQGPSGMYYFSWGGVGVYTNALDYSDPEMGVTTMFYRDANDGLVARCSNHFGHSLRDDYFQNHYDGVNQVLGLVSHVGTDPVTIFRVHANRLKNLGL